jgi:hypothetical protein
MAQNSAVMAPVDRPGCAMCGAGISTFVGVYRSGYAACAARENGYLKQPGIPWRRETAIRSHGPEAVDFLATIHAKERIPGGAAAFAVLDDTDRATLDRLLDSYHDQGLTATLERQARTFLISYREIDKHAGVLDAAERERLDQILAEPGDLPRVPTAPRRRSIPWRWVSAALAVFVTIGLGVGVESYVSSPQSGPPPAAGGPQPPGQQVEPEATDLQNLRRLLRIRAMDRIARRARMAAGSRRQRRCRQRDRRSCRYH